MKIKLTFTVDTDDGDYEMTINNLSNPDQPVSFDVIKKVITKITKDVEKQIIGLPDIKIPTVRRDN